MSEIPLTQINTDTRWHAYLILGAGLIAASFAAIFIRLAQAEHVPSLLITALRLLLSWLILTPWVLSHHRAELARLNRRDLLFAGIAGVWLAIHFLTLMLALENTTVLVSQVLVGTNPLWVALLEIIFLKVRIKPISWAGLILALAGGIIIALSGASEINLGHNPALGVGLAVTSSLAVTLYLVAGRKLRATISAMPYIWLVFGCAALTASLGVIVTGTPVAGYTIDGYFWVLLLTLIPQLIGHSAMNYALGYVSATYVSVAGQVVIVISGFLALLLFNEVPHILQIPGSIAIIAGIVIVSFGKLNSDQATSS